MEQCNHPGVIQKTKTVAECGKRVGQKMWFECARCGATEPFTQFTALQAGEYNDRRGFTASAPVSAGWS